MMSVKNEDEPFESAAVAAAWEQMVTACNVPAAAEPMLGSQTTWRHWSCSARRRRRPAPAGAAKRRNTELVTEKSF